MDNNTLILAAATIFAGGIGKGRQVEGETFPRPAYSFATCIEKARAIVDEVENDFTGAEEESASGGVEDTGAAIALALNDPRYTWRSLAALMAASGKGETETLAILDSLGARNSGHDYFTLRA